LRFVDSLSIPERAQLFELHAIECNVTNQVSEALASATQALALWRECGDALAQARVLLLIGRQYWKSGQNILANRHVGDAIALLETLPRGRELGMAYSARSQLAMTNDEMDEALEYGRRALEFAAQFDDTRRAGPRSQQHGHRAGNPATPAGSRSWKKASRSRSSMICMTMRACLRQPREQFRCGNALNKLVLRYLPEGIEVLRSARRAGLFIHPCLRSTLRTHRRSLG
jgi:tetratricopeptide (TPR) repeat protein